MTPMPPTRARVAEVSAPGRGAIATLRVWGPGALGITSASFRPNGGRSLATTLPNRLRVGRIGAGLGDEVVAVILPVNPPEVEIQCHGGPAAVALVTDALVAAGAKRASPRRWLRHSTGSQLRADAHWALTRAATLPVAAILLDQAEGALDADLARVVAALDAGAARQALTDLTTLIDRGRFGVRLLGGWRVVLAGRPNVGKSRLLNALAGYDRAIVAPTPGTTRDVVTIATALAAWPVEVSDTAGLRVTDDPIEQAGVERARVHQRAADLVVVVLDRSEPLTEADHAIRAEHPAALVVASKADLPPAWDALTVADLAVAAERGDGIEDLVAALVARLDLPVPPAGSGVPFRPIHLRRLQAIRVQVAAGHFSRARRSLGGWLGGEPTHPAEEPG